MDTSALCRPVVYVTVRQLSLRTQLRELFERQGFTVVEQPTGFHVIQAIADLIEGSASWRVPLLLVVDRVSPGCTGTTIATGLAELGLAIPIVLVDDPAQALREAQRAGERVRQENAGRYVSGSSPGLPDKMRSAG